MQNKKGQEGITIGTLLLIVLGVVVVVVLIIGFTKGFGFIFGKQDVLPLQQMQAIAKSCELSAGTGTSALAVDYCATLKMASKGVYVTCNYGPISNAIPGAVTKPDCNSDQMLPLLKASCDSLKPSATNRIIVYTKGSDGLLVTGTAVAEVTNTKTCKDLVI